MSSRRSIKDISCSRCKVKKIRCNKAHPKCDKCDAVDAECAYLPRKVREKKSGEKDILSNVLKRLERLEKHCLLGRLGEEDEDAFSPRSDSEFNSSIPQAEEERERSQQYRDLLYQMRYAGSILMKDETISKTLEATMKEIGSSTIPKGCPSTDALPVSKETAKKWINLAFDVSQLGIFQNPLGRDFMCTIPDLLEISHVKLDSTCLMIFYSWLLHGMIIDKEHLYERGAVAQKLYERCTSLVDKWRSEAQNTYTDFYAAFLMISMALEGCNIELGWEVFGVACKIAKALGHFAMDKSTPDEHDIHMDESARNESFASKNRKRYEFWYLLQVDCIFRLYFGRPASIPEGSWVVKFPDPTINGVDDVSTHFLQIHFLATMRFNLVLLKYLDLTAKEHTSHPAEYDEALDNLLVEVRSIMSNWKAEDLLETTSTTSDMGFCADILFNGYKILIILQSSKKCNQQSAGVPSESVDIARVSLTTIQTVLNGAPQVYWGTSPILLNQFIPFLVLCSNIASSREQGVNEVDLALVTWISDNLGKEAEGQVRTSPIRRIMRALAGACQQIAQATVDYANTDDPRLGAINRRN